MTGVSARAAVFDGLAGTRHRMRALLGSTALVPAITIFAAVGLSVLPSAAQGQAVVIQNADDIVDGDGLIGTQPNPWSLVSLRIAESNGEAASLSIINGGTVRLC